METSLEIPKGIFNVDVTSSFRAAFLKSFQGGHDSYMQIYLEKKVTEGYLIQFWTLIYGVGDLLVQQYLAPRPGQTLQ